MGTAKETQEGRWVTSHIGPVVGVTDVFPQELATIGIQPGLILVTPASTPGSDAVQSTVHTVHTLSIRRFPHSIKSSLFDGKNVEIHLS